MAEAGTQFVRLVDQATAELRETLCRVQSSEIEDLVRRITEARRLACYGVGREGLAMKGLVRGKHMPCEPTSHTSAQESENLCNLPVAGDATLSLWAVGAGGEDVVRCSMSVPHLLDLSDRKKGVGATLILQLHKAV